MHHFFLNLETNDIEISLTYFRDPVHSDKHTGKPSNITILNAKTHYKWPLSILMLTRQRVFSISEDSDIPLTIPHILFLSIDIPISPWFPYLETQQVPLTTHAGCSSPMREKIRTYVT